MDSVRGPPQVVGQINKKSFVLDDPLLVTALDFDRRALDQLAHGLNLTVTYTYNHARGINKNGFFKHKGKPKNPSHSEGGKDVYCLLKNIHHRRKTYSELLNQDKKEINETVRFLQKKIRNAMAHQTYLNCPGLSDPNSKSICVIDKTKLTEECLNKCCKLLQWVVDADFYKNIRKKVNIFLTNIKNMKKVFEDFKAVKDLQSVKDKEASYADTGKAKDILHRLLKALEKEEQKVEEDEEKEKLIRDRPITHLINMVLGPRLNDS